MAIGCGPKVSKIILVIFNFIFLLIGGAVLGFGIRVLMQSSQLLEMDKTGIVTVMANIFAYIIIGLGGFIFLISFLGCCGALCENKCMLGCYICLVIFLLLLVAIVGAVFIYFTAVAAAILQAVADQSYATMMQDPLINQTSAGPIYTPLGKALQVFQFTQECCGKKGPLDYKDHQISKLGYPVLPTCCKVEANYEINGTHAETKQVVNWDECSREANLVFSMNSVAIPGVEFKQLHIDGCSGDWYDAINSVKTIVIIGTAFIVAFEILCIIIAICLCTNVDNERSSVY